MCVCVCVFIGDLHYIFPACKNLQIYCWAQGMGSFGGISQPSSQGSVATYARSGGIFINSLLQTVKEF